MEDDGDGSLFPWSSGSWIEAVAAQRQLVATHSWEDVQRIVNTSYTREELRRPRNRQRLMTLVGLGALLYQNPDDDTADVEARRRDRRGDLVKGIRYLLDLVAVSTYDEALVRSSPMFASLVEVVRSVSVEDLECVFDVKMMDECARRLANFLFQRAWTDRRYDDFFMALRINELDSGSEDPESDVVTKFQLAKHLLEYPVVSDIDAEVRFSQIQQLAPLLLSLADYVSEDLRRISERANSVSAADIPRQREPDDYRSGSIRLYRIFEATGNLNYLDDILLLSWGARSGESSGDTASRLTDLGVALNLRGRLSGRYDALRECSQGSNRGD